MTDDRGSAPLPPTVEPLDVDGVRAVTVGTVMWAVALVALLPFWSALEDDGRLWWIGTCAVGVLLGLVGLVHLRLRRRRHQRTPTRTRH